MHKVIEYSHNVTFFVIHIQQRNAADTEKVSF